VEQVVAGHPGLARDAGGDDDEVRARRLVVAVGADDARVVELDRRRLPLIETLPLRDALGDVDHDDSPGQLLLGDGLRGGGADVTGTDDRDLVNHVLGVLADERMIEQQEVSGGWYGPIRPPGTARGARRSSSAGVRAPGASSPTLPGRAAAGARRRAA